MGVIGRVGGKVTEGLLASIPDRMTALPHLGPNFQIP